MKQSLTRSLFEDTYQSIQPRHGTMGSLFYAPIRKLLGLRGLEVVRRTPRAARVEGRDLPLEAETMVGLLRLDNLSSCIKDVVDRNIPGDLLEAGVWRGGASIFMRAALRAYGAADRRVWVAD